LRDNAAIDQLPGVIRRLIALALLSLLAACHKPDSALAPFVQTRLPPNVETRYWPPAGWAWGILEIAGQPGQRYGVSAAPALASADVIILTGYGESAEMWLETARDLNQQGYTVWVLEAAGQGGSGRYIRPRDLGYTPAFVGDVAAIDLFVQRIVRPLKDRPVTVIASGTAWLPALAAFEARPLADHLILSNPVEPSTPTGSGRATQRATGQAAWQRPPPDANLPHRQRAALAWAVANPDLRMGGKAWGWFTARAKLREQALGADRLVRVQTPVLVLTRKAGTTPCLRMPHCVEQSIAASGAYQQAEDSDRGPWISAIETALTADHAQ
jgi:lysophospholipase